MKDKVAWTLLAAENRTNRKTALLAKEFEKRKKEVDLTSAAARKIEEEIESAMAKGCGYITYIDEEYPDELKNIAYPPPYLYVKGDVRLLKYPLKATIVGSRNATAYGLNVAANFANELACNGICVVTGGARGIDTAAVRGAMRANGKVVVVVGTGIDVCYPPENRELFERVSKNGLIVSEFPLGMGPLAQNFPIRNRVMTAIADGVVVVEAAEKSGALISASHALEQGKTIFAVPGNIDMPQSAGTNALLRDGAMFALSACDILFEMMDREPEKYRAIRDYDNLTEETREEDKKAEVNEKENSAALSPMENAIVNALKKGKNSYDEILEFCALEPNKLTSLLTIMEIKGIIKLAFGNRYNLNTDVPRL